MAEEEGSNLLSSKLPYQISQEHCYSKLAPFRGTASEDTFPTVVIFPGGVRTRGEESPLDLGEEDEVEEDIELDVVSVDPVPDLPYDDRKVNAIMLECVRHMNLVKTPPGSSSSGVLLEKAMSECSYQQRSLLVKLVKILEEDHLARLTYTNVAHEAIKRRLNSDRSTRMFRKAFTEINWDSKLTRWAHETLLQVLDSELLPVYLDILQALKSKCPVLVEHMIHSSVSMVGGEAFGLLLKRPWNPVIGMQPLDRQVKFEPSPLLITIPHSSMGLGGRRWRLWQSQFSSVGKVYPIILPSYLTELGQGTGLRGFAEEMMTVSLERVQETICRQHVMVTPCIPCLATSSPTIIHSFSPLRSQFPTRPIVLFGWSLGARIACKIAEVEPIACIISLGLPAAGVEHKWEVSSDPFQTCKSPTMFAVGSEGRLSSADYVENLRSHMSCTTSLVVVGGGDDLLRLSHESKCAEYTTQSIVDRCIMEKVYEFMVHVLPCSFPEELKYGRKRKSSHTDEIGSTFLTPAVPQSPIILTSPSEDQERNFNFNNSNPLLWKAVLGLKQGGRSSPGGSHSGTPSPVHFERRLAQEGPPLKRPLIGELPKMGRPRSKSVVEKPKKKCPVRSRSKSSDQPNPQKAPNTFSPIPILNLAGNSNTNNSNNTSSPLHMLSFSQAHFRPLPITPPRNPFEDPSQKLDPKTLKHLQRK